VKVVSGSRPPGPAGQPGEPPAIFTLLDQIADSVLVAEPMIDASGNLTDFSIVHLSPGYLDPAGRGVADLAGATLRSAYPGSAAGDGLFARAAAVLSSGVPLAVPGASAGLFGGGDGAPVADLRAARYDGRVVFTWRERPGDDGRLGELLEHGRTWIALAAARDLLADSEQRAAEEHELALRLQRAIMPADVRLVEAAGVDIAVRCRPATAGSLVAGDWYDALQLPDGDLLFVVGDIVGHGIEAVTGMVAARNALRGLAVTGGDPRDLLEKLNYAACLFTEGIIGTVICGRYDRRTRLLRWARAGHLPPVLVRGHRAEVQPMPEGMLLGLELDAEYEQATLQLETGDTLLLYTDGLIERRAASISDALADLATAAVPADPDIDTHVARILATAASDTGDDACLLAVRIR
jgi:serine phosphatase RsbU (regulator of sigma subunit)